MAGGLYPPAAGDDLWATFADQDILALNSGFVLDQAGNNATGAFTTNATWASGTTFTIPTDVTAVYVAKRRLKIVHAGGTTYCEVSSSVFGASTTVTIANITSGPTTMTSPITSVAFGLDLPGYLGNVPGLLTANASLAAVTATTSATVYQDGPSVALSTGTWLVTTQVAAATTGGGGRTVYFKLWNGATTYAARNFQIGASTLNAYGSMSSIISATGAVTVKVSGIVDAATTNTSFQVADNFSGNSPVSYINAVRISVST